MGDGFGLVGLAVAVQIAIVRFVAVDVGRVDGARTHCAARPEIGLHFDLCQLRQIRRRERFSKPLIGRCELIDQLFERGAGGGRLAAQGFGRSDVFFCYIAAAVEVLCDCQRAAVFKFQNRVDLIVAFEPQTVRAAKPATSQVPIVFLHVDDPVADGFVHSLAHPGGNLTGFAGNPQLDDKRLQIFKELVPRLHRLLILLDPTDPGTARLRAVVQEAGTALKLQLVERDVATPTDIERVFGSLKPGDVDGVFVVSLNLNTKFPSLIQRLASERHLPLPGPSKKLMAEGALFYYGVNYRDLGVAAAKYVDKILKGTKPADLPVEYPTRFELILNRKTAQALGLAIPQPLLLRADEVIQ